jgi:hypothetical protein
VDGAGLLIILVATFLLGETEAVPELETDAVFFGDTERFLG